MYTLKTVTRIEEGASLEDVLNGDAYETAYLVYDENGEIILDTTDRDFATEYVERRNNNFYADLALEMQEQM